ncbi:MAG: hypothetical protein JSW34_07045, partial [Candidatus Zixiibacteriota bacterium]
FPVEEKELKWKDFTAMKQAQGEVYFKPSIYHLYDNYFRLVSSVYERSEDGFFWVDFNRYNFSFDPNRPEEAYISYEFEAADKAATDAACFRRSEAADTGDMAGSDLRYETTSTDKRATIEMGGMDGAKIMNARGEMDLVVNVDSLRYLSTFLHFNLKEDSIYCNGVPVDYHRRKDFNYIGIVLPQYAHRGDTLALTYWYKGKDFGYAMPWVEDPSPTPHSFTFIIPGGFNYIMPGMGEVRKINGQDQFEVILDQPFNRFYFQGYASGFDTIAVVSDMGITVNFLKAKHITKQLDCFVPDKLYRGTIMDAFNFMSGRVGNPAGAFELFVYPENYYSMPGMVEVPQVVCYTAGGMEAVGGFNIFAGYSMAKQWFGSLLKPASQREVWLRDAASDYLSLLFIQHSLGTNTYYTNLLNRRDSVYTLHELRRDRPLATGLRAGSISRCNKGVWLFHMLRFLMYDLETKSESKFFRFFYELGTACNATRFTNADVISLAEKHYGRPLDWFFKQWLCQFGYPEYKVEYTFEEKPDGHYINVAVKTEGVDPNFSMPVMLRVEHENGQSEFLREDIRGARSSFALGPYESQPKELIFNEYFSVLSKDGVKKK